MKTASKIFLLLLLTTILGACSTSNSVVSERLIQKRKYTKGFYLDKNNFGINKDAKGSCADEMSSIVESERDHFLEKKESEKFTFTLDFNKKGTTPIDKALEADDCGDTLVYITGKSVLVNIINVGDEKITYTKCDDPNKREYSLSKDEAGYINYLNGETELFNDPDDPKASKKKESTRDDGIVRDEIFALPSLVLVGVGFILGLVTFPFIGFAVALLGVVFALLSLKAYKADPDKFTKRSRPIAWISLVLGGVLALIFMMVGIQGL